MQDNRPFPIRVEGSKLVYREMYNKEPLQIAMSMDTFRLWESETNDTIKFHHDIHTQITCCGLKVKIDNNLKENDFIIGVNL